HPSRDKLKEESVRIRTTLLEYGVIGSGSAQRVITSSTDIGKSIGQSQQHSTTKEANDAAQKPRSDSDTQAVENLLHSMTEASGNHSGNLVKVPTSVVGQIVSEQSDEIRRLAEAYERKKSSLSAADIAFLKKETK